MSNAVDRPVCPCSSRKWKRLLVSSGVPKPANMRIVHSLPRYIVSWTPRVYGILARIADLFVRAHVFRLVDGLSGMPLIVA